MVPPAMNQSANFPVEVLGCSHRFMEDSSDDASRDLCPIEWASEPGWVASLRIIASSFGISSAAIIRRQLPFSSLCNRIEASRTRPSTDWHCSNKVTAFVLGRFATIPGMIRSVLIGQRSNQESCLPRNAGVAAQVAGDPRKATPPDS